LRESFQKQLKTRTELESIKFEITEYGWNNFRKIIWGVADGLLERIKNTARHLSEKGLCSMEGRRELERGLYK